MNKLSLIARKTITILLLFTLVLTLNITAFADSPDTSPNIPRRTEKTTQPASNNNSSTIPADVSPVKTYTVVLGKTYKLPADVKQVGDGYSPSNSSILKVDGKTGSFTTLGNGTVYIVIANNGTTRYIKVIVGSGTTTQTKSALTGYTVAVNDRTTPATSCNFQMVSVVEQCLFLSANGTILGSMSANDYRKIAQLGIDNGTVPTDSRELAKWFADEFNKYRGLSASASSNTGNQTTGNETTISSKSLDKLINEQRNKDGLSELTYDSGMQDLADIRAREIATQSGHARPSGGTVADNGYAEILHMGSSTTSGAFQSLYNSTAHKNIMLSTRYGNYACGYYTDGTYHYWVVLFSE